MNCKQAEALVAADADGEVDTLRHHSLRQHLQICMGCTARQRRILELRKRIRDEVPYFAASPALHARVRATMDATHGSVPSWKRSSGERWAWLTSGVLAGCAASALAWIVGTAVLAWQANEDFGVAAVGAHVRATLGDHLIEIASSDRHTVKPWLSARLDYSPPVQDLAQQGFPLIGGRLEELERRPVAALVYRYRKHTIDVFVRPVASPASTSSLRNVRGFNVAHATGPSMDWLAVSDAEPEVLSAFVQRLAREEIPQETPQRE